MRSIIIVWLLIISSYASAQKYFLFIGSYTGSGSKGIYVYNFDASTGDLTFVSHTEGVVNPSFLTLSPNGKFVYACTETRTDNAGSISAFSFNRQTGMISFINKVPSGGDNPVYVTAHKNGRWLVCGNYTGGSVSAFEVNKDGSILPVKQNIRHTGQSINPQRQDRPHVHSTIFSPDQKYLYVPDLGLDKVMVYRFVESLVTPLRPFLPPSVKTKPGSGPRHLVFHPNGKYAYLAEEMEGATSVYKYVDGKLDLLQRVATHPVNAKGPFSTADIHVSPDGRFLYVTNRGEENNVAIFSVHAITGKLTWVGYEPTQGEVPRNFIIEPSGKYLLVGNQQSGNVVVFKINKKTGLLRATGKQVKVAEVSCLQMLKM